MALTQQERDRKKRLAEQQLANAPRDAQGNILGKNQAGRTIAVVQGTRNATDTADLTTTKLAKDQPKTSASGVQVGEKRDVPGAISADQMTPTSYEQIGAIQQEQDYQGTKDVADALGLAENAPSDLEAYIKAQVNAKKAQDKSQQLALEGQRMDLRSQAGAVTSQAEAAQAMAASGLNAPQSNLALSGGYQEAAKAQMDRLKIDDQQIALYDSQLKQAQLDGDLELAQSIQANKDAYVNQAMANEAAYVSALGDYEKTKAAVTQSNLASFQSLVDEGQELSVEAISGFAGQLGIPFEDAYGYYAGLQSIRDDKTLSLEEKDVAIQQAKQDLNDQINGLTTAQAQNINYLQQLRQSGASEEVVSAFKNMAGITDYDDPLTAAELEYQQLENQIKQNQLAGIPTSIAEYETLFDLRQKANAAAGTGGEAYVSSSIDGISMEYEGGALNVTLPRNADGSLKAYQCGEFVNRAWGLPAGGTDGFGSTAADKRDLVSRKGFFTKDMGFAELASAIKPGMAFASTAGTTDHTGLIVSGVDAMGNYQTLEANVGDNNPNVSDPPIYKTRNIKDQDVYGFVYPPNAETISGGSDVLQEAQAISLLQGFGGTEGERATLVSSMQSLVSSGMATDLADAKKQLGFKTTDDENFIKNVETELKTPKATFQEISGKLGSLPALMESETGIADVSALVNYLKVLDPNSVARESEVAAVQSATSALGQISNTISQLKTGEKLNDTQRQELLDAVNVIKSATAKKLYSDVLSYQQDFADRGLDFSVVSPTFTNTLSSLLTEDEMATINSDLGIVNEEDAYLDTVVDYGTNSDIYDFIDEQQGAATQTNFTQTAPQGGNYLQNLYSKFQK